MQSIESISISSGSPVIFLPLSVILSLTAIKDLFEDLKRHKSDKEENSRKVKVIRNGAIFDTEWENIYCGDILRVKK